ncbi:SIP domain-containing protein [Halobacteriovorax sp.]|uniref:SIP domain-containing protein n=1 Tax=Halobacteriovorax sp. TaxID=2020862 RepID=UPI003AF2E38E
MTVSISDLTSINAVRAYLNLIPADATGKATICIPSEDDILELQTKGRVEINFVTIESDDVYSGVFKNYDKLSDKTIIFAAGEFHKVKSLKESIKEIGIVKSENTFISSYWKRGMDDASFRDEKRKKNV